MLQIFVSDSKPYIWKAEDARVAREKYRIVGTLVGCLPRLPMQNVCLGMPIQLLREEAQLLLDLDVAVIIGNSEVTPLASEQEIVEFEKKRKELYQGQVALMKENRKAEIYRRQDQIIEGKTSKKRRILQQEGVKEEDIEQQIASLQSELENHLDSVQIPPLLEKHSCVQLSTACLRDAELPGVAWHYPSSPQERLKYRVFKDLWERGYSLTSGGKFGGDYLVYPGDPARFHSFFIARCVPYTEKLPVQGIVSLGRMGSSVKKTVLLCSVGSRADVKYTSLQWTGFT